MLSFQPTIPQHSTTLFVCPWCCESWARALGEALPALVVSRPCLGCIPAPPCFHLPGSLCSPFDFVRSLDWLPRPLAIREFQIYLDNWLASPHSTPPLSLRPTMQTTPSLELMQRIAELRPKAVNGTITDDELREAYILMRAERTAAAKSAKERKSATEKSNPDDVLALF